MQTHIHTNLASLQSVVAADQILRSCVHCGFCLSTCPTYRITGDEADSPRGRIYLIKNVLEQGKYPAATQKHLDRCLSCRACESVCPSGVEYAKLLDTGRQLMADNRRRTLFDRFRRRALVEVMSRKSIFGSLFWLGQTLRFALPGPIKRLIPPRVQTEQSRHSEAIVKSPARKMLVLEGCVQSTLDPMLNRKLAKLLAVKDVQLLSIARGQCCGALSWHTGVHKKGKADIRALIDLCWPLIESGIEKIVFTASGCGAFMQDYATILAADEQYLEKARHIESMCCDASEVVAELFRGYSVTGTGQKVAWHSPCTLQHGLKSKGVVESILRSAGFAVVVPTDSAICCGSAGSYSLLERALSGELQQQKIRSIEKTDPDIVATANIGCQTHLQAVTELPVKHWLDLVTDPFLDATD